MDWTNVIEQVLELLVYPVLTAAGLYLASLLRVKIKEAQQKIDSEDTKKYLTLLDDIIATAVAATNQTFVDKLKANGEFDEEAQEIAFEQTYSTVMNILPEDAATRIATLVGDLGAYVTNKIEFYIKANK